MGRICFQIWVMLLIFIITALPRYVSGKNCSDKIPPEWIKNPPKPLNNSYYFKVVEVDNGSELNSARVLSRKDLINSIGREFNIQVEEDLEKVSATVYKNSGVQYSDKEIYTLKVRSSDENVRIYCEKVDEYYEHLSIGGQKLFKLYTLYAVSRTTARPVFDQFRLTNRFGIHGVWRSAIVPGWGQLYKRNTTKGAFILTGAVALAGGIIVTESLRSSYLNKITGVRDPKVSRSYATKADNMTNIRNICIGGVIALYVYSIVDAAVAPGARRIILSPVRKGLSLQPIVNERMSGLAFTYRF